MLCTLEVTEGSLSAADLLNLESIQISNALLQEFQDIDEVRIVEVPENGPQSMMGPGGPRRVRTFAGLVYRKPGRNFGEFRGRN